MHTRKGIGGSNPSLSAKTFFLVRFPLGRRVWGDMNKKKLAVVGAFAALAVALCATASSLFWVCRKVRAFEAEHGGSAPSKPSMEAASTPT